MPRKLRDREERAFHHVFVRGNRKADVFRDDEDRRWFLGRLLQVEQESACLHVAHCLMTNHIHLLLRPGPGATGISRLLQRVLGAYTQWFNRRHGLVGHVFQGRFGSRTIDSDSDLLWILRYIHRNPVDAGLVPRAELWKWSSHADHLRPNPPEYLREGAELARSLIAEDPDRALVLYRRLVEHPDGDYLVPQPSELEEPAPLPQPAWAPGRPSLEDIALEVEARFAVRQGVLGGPGRSPVEREARRAFCRSARGEWRYTLAETAAFLGRSISQVSDLAREQEPQDGPRAREWVPGRRDAVIAGASIPKPKGSDPAVLAPPGYLSNLAREGGKTTAKG